MFYSFDVVYISVEWLSSNIWPSCWESFGMCAFKNNITSSVYLVRKVIRTYLSPASSSLLTPSFFSCSSRYAESSVFTQYRRDGAAQEAVRRSGRCEAAWRTFSWREPAEAAPTQQWRAGGNRVRVLFNKSFSTTLNLKCNIALLSDYQRKTTVITGELLSSTC